MKNKIDSLSPLNLREVPVEVPELNTMRNCTLPSLLNLHTLYRKVIFIPSNLASVSAVQQSHAELHLSLEVCVSIKVSDNRLW